MSKQLDRDTAAYWENRLFQNTYTRAGRTRVVPGWCVKIQWAGRRQTWRMNSGDRTTAAAEALALYRELRRGGWLAVDKARESRPSGGAVEGERRSEFGPVVVTTRKYVGNLNAGFDRELFATLTFQGRTEHVALGTEDPGAARLRAEDLQRDLRQQGWETFNRSQAREATLAVFWQANPMACTYTTLLTAPARSPLAPPRRSVGQGWRILVVEPADDVRRALLFWLGQAVGAARVEGRSSPAGVHRAHAWDLILANREQPAPALRELIGSSPTAPRLLTHGVFADSDAIFASFSGVSLGYLLRRLPPASLLAPLVTAFPEGPPRQPARVDRQVCRYFQAIFEPGGGGERLPSTAEFTAREREILDLLSRGFADKEIGGELGISVWTVHSHLKRIFAKYGVRTRTEAVVKHLQK